MKKTVVCLVACLMAVSCGFQPLYKQRTNSDLWNFSEQEKDTSIADEMEKIKVMPIKDRFGQQLRNNLLDLLTPKGIKRQPKYHLNVVLQSKVITQQAMRDDVTATNERVEYTVKYDLVEVKERKTLVSSTASAFVAYDILANPYSTTMASKKAESDAAQIIANDIALRLGAFFHNEMSSKI